MKPEKKNDFVRALNYLFKETFEGSPPKGSIYLDRGIGVFNTIGKLDAEFASTPVTNSTIAAHTEHLRYYLEILDVFLRGDMQIADWNKSWAIGTVSEEQWNEIRDNLRKTYKKVLGTFEKIKTWDEDRCSEAMGMVVHTAYHLGAIRQMVKAVKAGGSVG